MITLSKNAWVWICNYPLVIWLQDLYGSRLMTELSIFWIIWLWVKNECGIDASFLSQIHSLDSRKSFNFSICRLKYSNYNIFLYFKHFYNSFVQKDRCDVLWKVWKSETLKSTQSRCQAWNWKDMLVAKNMAMLLFCW